MELVKDIIDSTIVELVFEDDFRNNKNRWETCDNEKNVAQVRDGHYYMENKTEGNWYFYHKPVKINAGDDFMIDTVITLCTPEVDYWFQSFGVVWGFQKNPALLNRFVINAYGYPVACMFWRRNYNNLYSTNYHGFIDLELHTNPVRFVVLSVSGNIWFFINDIKSPVFSVCDDKSFLWTGDQVGFYLDPGLAIKAEYLKVFRIQSKRIKTDMFEDFIHIADYLSILF